MAAVPALRTVTVLRFICLHQKRSPRVDEENALRRTPPQRREIRCLFFVSIERSYSNGLTR
jgi:hypothetical protein